MSDTELHNTFSPHGIVVPMTPMIRGDRDHPGQMLTVTIGEDRAFITVPAALWELQCRAIAVGSRVQVRGRTDCGPVEPGSRSAAEYIEVMIGAGADRIH